MNTFKKTVKKTVKTMCAAMAAVAVVLCQSGCKSVPSADGIEETARAVGAAAGLIAGQTEMDDATRAAVVSIVGEISKVTPAAGQTFAEAWTPLAKEMVAKFVSEGKMESEVGDVALSAFDVAVKGLDYLLYVRYPEAREYTELVTAAVGGFTGGFLATFKATENDGGDVRVYVDRFDGAKVEVDGAAYDWLKARR